MFWRRKDRPVSEMSIKEYAKEKGLSPMNPDTLGAYIGELRAEYGLPGEQKHRPAPEAEPEIDEDAEDEAFKDDLDRLLEKKAALSSKKSEAEGEEGEQQKTKPYMNSWPSK